jgi:hypothetical protein
MADPTLLSHWETQIEAYRESRLTLQAWCDREGVSKERMKYWMYKRKAASQTRRSSASFVPIHVEPTAVFRQAKLPRKIVHFYPSSAWVFLFVKVSKIGFHQLPVQC